jgi:hypothetical protein
MFPPLGYCRCASRFGGSRAPDIQRVERGHQGDKGDTGTHTTVDKWIADRLLPLVDSGGSRSMTLAARLPAHFAICTLLNVRVRDAAKP